MITILVVIAILVCVLIAFALVTVAAKDDDFSPILAALFFLFIAGLGVFGLGRDSGIKRGQIDALNGKVKFERVVNGDEESVWREMEKTK